MTACILWVEDEPSIAEIVDFALTSSASASPVSVNLSGRHLLQPGFITQLATLLAAYPNVLPLDLELEILETATLENMTAVATLIADCRALGVNFALDDFGTGYSSLAYLKHLPVDVLKIDQSFVSVTIHPPTPALPRKGGGSLAKQRVGTPPLHLWGGGWGEGSERLLVSDLLADAEALAIVKGVIGLSLAFRHGVIAEGVETVEQGRLLIDLGCDFAQGYAIARPMPPEQIPDWIAGWQPPVAWQETT